MPLVRHSFADGWWRALRWSGVGVAPSCDRPAHGLNRALSTEELHLLRSIVSRQLGELDVSKRTRGVWPLCAYPRGRPNEAPTTGEAPRREILPRHDAWGSLDRAKAGGTWEMLNRCFPEGAGGMASGNS